MKIHALVIATLTVVGSSVVFGQTIRNVFKPDPDTTWTLKGDVFSFQGASRTESWTWDGEVLKPLKVGDRDREFEYRSGVLRRNGLTVVCKPHELSVRGGRVDPDSFQLKLGRWEPVHGARLEHTWQVDGNLPVPLIAFVVFDLHHRP